MSEAVELQLNTEPSTHKHFPDADAAAQWVIANFDDVDTHFLEAVEQGEVDPLVLHAFLVQIGGFGQTAMTDPNLASSVLRRNSFGYIGELVEALEAGGYPDAVLDDFADAYQGFMELNNLDFKTQAAKMPGWLKGRINPDRAAKVDEA